MAPLEPVNFPVPNSYGPPAACFDFDGTLAATTPGSWHPGEPLWPMIELARRLHERGWYVIIASARPASHHPILYKWLTEHNVYVDQIACGSKPAADVFIDDKSPFLPIRALEEWIELHRHPDPRQLWAQASSHTPMQQDFRLPGSNDDDTFRVVVPVSGGMDSMTCWAMAEEHEGFTVVPVYVNTGALYAADELRAAREVMGGTLPLNVFVDVDYERLHGYIDVGRNAIIIWTLAQLMQEQGYWGEIWFGSTGSHTDTAVRQGDKSARFLLDMQQLLAGASLDVRLCSPLEGMQKHDLVGWWEARDRLAEFAKTRSCHSIGEKGCGSCRSCYFRWEAWDRHDLASMVADSYVRQEWLDNPALWSEKFSGFNK